MASCLRCSSFTPSLGTPNLDFETSMRAEHCIKHGHSFSFTTGNYHITTTPLKEWEYVVGHKQGYPVPCPDMGSGRRLRALEELMHIPLTVKSGLTRAEVIAVVLYTGPMVFHLHSTRNRCMLVPLPPFHASCSSKSTTVSYAAILSPLTNSFPLTTTLFQPPSLSLCQLSKKSPVVCTLPPGRCCTAASGAN